MKYGLKKTNPNLPQQNLRERAKELVQKIEPFVWELSEILYRIKEDQLYMVGAVTYATFDDYINGELAFSSRRARYYTRIFEKFNLADVGGDVVNRLGSSKARLLAKVITKENKDKWIDRADHTTFRELDKEIQEKTRGGQIHGFRMGSISIPYCHGDTRLAWLEVKDLVSKMEGVESSEGVLEILIAEFMSVYGVGGTHDQEEISKSISDYEILRLYNWRCGNAECGKRLSLAVHHIIFRSQDPTLIDDPANKIPLCQGCHDEIHLRGGKLIKIKGVWTIKKR